MKRVQTHTFILVSSHAPLSAARVCGLGGHYMVHTIKKCAASRGNSQHDVFSCTSRINKEYGKIIGASTRDGTAAPPRRGAWSVSPKPA